MESGRASLTALAAAVMRAVHGRCDPSPLLRDPYGDRFLTEAEKPFVLKRLLLALPDSLRDEIGAMASPSAAFDAAVRAHPAFAGIVVRARFAEDALLAAIRRGVRQYVAVAAGMDTLALRHPELAAILRVVEVDHPATQEMKRQRFALAGLEIPPNVELVAADLEKQALHEALAGSDHDPASATFFAVLGLTPYLAREANLALLASIASVAAAGSEIVLDYLDAEVFSNVRAADDIDRLARERAETDEPWVSGFTAKELRDALAGLGIEVSEDLDGTALRRLYASARMQELAVPVHLHIARARPSDGGA